MRPTQRIAGIDASRGVAILGMIVLHSLPAASIAEIPALSSLVDNNKPQILFALLDGIALVLIASLPRNADRGAADREILIRALVLFALGSLLWQMGSGVEVILDYYAVYFVLALPFLRSTTGRGLALVVGSALLCSGPAIQELFMGQLAIWGYIPTWLNPFATYFISGTYPAIVYMGFVLIGIWITRFCLERAARISWMSLVPFLIAYVSLRLISWGCKTYEVQEPFPWIITTLDNAGSLAASLFWVVALILLLDKYNFRATNLILMPLNFMGVIPVTIYSIHVMIMAFGVSIVGISGIQSIGLLCVQLVVISALGVFIVKSGHKGPFERFSSWVSSPIFKS